MASRAFSRSKVSILASGLFRVIYSTPIIKESLLPVKSKVSAFGIDSWKPICGFRLYHDGRPRGPLWRGKKLIGKEALFVILGLKRFKDDEEKLHKFIKTHVMRLLKLDMIAVLVELERQEEVTLAIKVLSFCLECVVRCIGSFGSFSYFVIVILIYFSLSVPLSPLFSYIACNVFD